METEKLLSTTEAAKLFNVHPDTLRDWEKKGVISSFRFGEKSHRRFRQSDVERIIGVQPSPSTKKRNLKSLLTDLEARFKVNYPQNNAATYNSLVNYRSDLSEPIQRWYNYKEGYSLELNNLIFKYFGVRAGSGDLIIDPFSGGGSTLLAAKQYGLNSAGFEVNPFSYFLSKVKTANYTDELELIQELLTKLRALSLDPKYQPELPALSISQKAFEMHDLAKLMQLRDWVNKIEADKVRDLYFLAWLSLLEEFSNYRKAGNGLKIRKSFKHKVEHDIQNAFVKRMEVMVQDIEHSTSGNEPEIYRKTSLNLIDELKAGMARGVIFSPPYANCFDYTEIYKIELWFGQFVHEYPDLKKLRGETLRSHLNRAYDSTEPIVSEELEPILSELKGKQLWDKKIPYMVNGYFQDMEQVLKQCYKALEKNGFCCVIVSNSAYAGVIVPTDLIIAAMAEKIGFKIDKIDVARYIITSSQQYEQTLPLRGFLRESIIYMEKN
jgi:excisionase family DNA binding protein